jgi:hypothetical protein
MTTNEHGVFHTARSIAAKKALVQVANTLKRGLPAENKCEGGGDAQGVVQGVGVGREEKGRLSPNSPPRGKGSSVRGAGGGGGHGWRARA